MPEFRPPSFLQPDTSARDIPRSIDQLFEAYQQMKNKRDLMARQQGENLLTYGFDPARVTPDILAAAGQPAQPVEDPIFGAVRSYVEKKKAAQQLDIEAKKTGITKEQEQARLTGATADLYTRGVTPGGARGMNRPPPGYRFLPEGDLEAIPGGPAAVKLEIKSEKEAALGKSAIAQADRIIGKVDQALSNIGPLSVGFGASLGRIPGTAAKNLASDLQTIKANLGFAELQAMRQASPTGGALGQVAVQELEALQATVASLDQQQSQEQLRRNLNEVKQHYENWKSAVRQSSGETAAAPVSGMPEKTISLTGDKAARLAELRAKAGRK